jgi:hypothetical protein
MGHVCEDNLVSSRPQEISLRNNVRVDKEGCEDSFRCALEAFIIIHRTAEY